MRSIDAGRLRDIIEAQREIMICGPDVDAVMRVTAERAQALTGASAGVIEIAEGDHMVYRAASGSAADSLGVRLEIASSLSGLSVRRREILVAEDTETDPRVDRDACRRVGARSMVVVPLFYEGACIGALKVMAPTPRAFDSGDVAVLQLMVGFIASAMGHAAAHDAVVASESRFRAVAELAVDAITTLDADGRVTFWNGSAARLFGYGSDEILGRPLTLVVPNLEAAKESARIRPLGPDEPRDAPISSPPSSRLVGKVVELEARRSDGSEIPIEVALSEWIADGSEHYTAVMRDIRERKRLEAETLDRLRVDQLTGLLVRRAGNERLRQEAERAQRYHEPFSVVMLDLDHFKRVNDTYGHQVGDEVLRRVGSVVRGIVRESDTAVRWGGEELLVLLAETVLEGGVECAERIRSAVAALSMGAVGHVTLSAGVASAASYESLDEVIARADAKLYDAKSAGRDRVAS